MSDLRPPLILASTSRYRRELLERLRLPFTAESPAVDESALQGEAPAALAERLAEGKARAVAARHRAHAVVIGSDQVAACAGRRLGKPGTPEKACEQLAAASGQVVVFHTAVAIVHDGTAQHHRDETRVRFRTLSRAEIERYVELESPLDCAGSFKSEGLGIALFEAIESKDPTALVGLPLVWVAAALARAGLDPLRSG
jgi:septum formation protein